MWSGGASSFAETDDSAEVDMSKKTIGVIGYGNVGKALGSSWQKRGYEVTFGVRDLQGAKVKQFQEANRGLRVAGNEEVLESCEVIALVTPPDAAVSLAGQYANLLAGKPVIDCTNRIDENGRLVGSAGESVAEQIARQAPGAHIVKCFNTLGWENFENSAYPGYGDLKPIMLLCGDDDPSNKVVAEIAEAMGFESCIVGGLEMAHYLEAWAMVWIVMGRFQGKGSDFAFAMLKR